MARDGVPLFPLGTVLFPGARLPLRIFEVRYMDMAKECLKHGTPFGVCLIREGAEVGAPAVPEPVGCLARIAEADMAELGILKVTALGLERFRLREWNAQPSGLLVGDIEELAPEPAANPPELADCAAFLAKVVAGIGADRFAPPLRYEDAGWVGFRIAEVLPLRNDVKQKLLELTDASARLAVLHRFLARQNLLG